MYNEKKKESRRIMEKKEDKIREMNDLLKKDIEPQMDKLRKVRNHWKRENCVCVGDIQIFSSFQIID